MLSSFIKHTNFQHQLIINLQIFRVKFCILGQWLTLLKSTIKFCYVLRKEVVIKGLQQSKRINPNMFSLDSAERLMNYSLLVTSHCPFTGMKAPGMCSREEIPGSCWLLVRGTTGVTCEATVGDDSTKTFFFAPLIRIVPDLSISTQQANPYFHALWSYSI